MGTSRRSSGDRTSTKSGAASWMKIAFAAVVSFVATTNSTTVKA